MDVARIARQGYNGRRGRNNMSDGWRDRSYAEKRLSYQMNLCQANSGEKEKRGKGRWKSILMLMFEIK